MHIANVIVKCRAFLTDAESYYGTGYKGAASEYLADLGVFLREEIPGMTNEPDPADPVDAGGAAAAKDEPPEKPANEKTEKTEQASQKGK